MGGATANEVGTFFAAVRLNNDLTLDETFNPTTSPVSLYGTHPGTMYIPFSICSAANNYKSDTCNGIAIDSNNNIIMAGFTNEYSGETLLSYFAAARILGATSGNNPAGTVDTAGFNANSSYGLHRGTMYISNSICSTLGTINDTCNAVAIQANGKIVMGGSTANTIAHYFAAARLNTDGTLDTLNFNPTETIYGDNVGTMYVPFSIGYSDGTYDSCKAIAIDNDGNIVLAGSTSRNSSPTNAFAVARVLSTIAAGTLDTENFNSEGVQPGTMFIDFYLSDFNRTGITNSSTESGLTNFCAGLAIVPNSLTNDGNIVLGGYGPKEGSSGNYGLAIAEVSSTTVDGKAPGTLDIAGFPGQGIVTDNGSPINKSGTQAVYDFGVTYGTTTDECTTLAIQSDGKIVLAGVTQTQFSDGSVGNSYFAAARYLPNGQLDPSFGGYNGTQPGVMYVPFSIAFPTGQAIDICNSVTIQPDGKIVLGGYSNYNGGGNTYFAAVRLLSNGHLDTTFNAAGQNGAIPGTLWIPGQGEGRGIGGAGYDYCTSIALDHNQNIVMGGYTAYAQSTFFAAARITPAGILDATFNADQVNGTPQGTMYIGFEGGLGIAGGTNDYCQSIAINPDNAIIMGGSSSNAQVNTYFSAARVTSAGVLDTTFNSGQVNNAPQGTIFINQSISSVTIPGDIDDECLSLALQSDGKIVMGGFTNHLNISGHDYFAVARLTKLGTPDITFGGTNGSPAGTAYVNGSISAETPSRTSDHCNSIAVQPNNQILLCGRTANNNNTTPSYLGVARFTETGILDTNFGTNGTLIINPSISGASTIFDGGNAILLQPDGKIVMGGYTLNNNLYFAIVRLINPANQQGFLGAYAQYGLGYYQ